MGIRLKRFSVIYQNELFQKLFAKQDYAGLSRKGQSVLTSQRNNIAANAAKILKGNKQGLKESIQHAMAHNRNGRTDAEIIKHETDMYRANNRYLLTKIRNQKQRARLDAQLSSNWANQSSGREGNAVGAERARIKDQARKAVDKVYDRRDSRGVRLELIDRLNQKRKLKEEASLGNLRGRLRNFDKDQARKAADVASRTDTGINKSLLERVGKYKQDKEGYMANRTARIGQIKSVQDRANARMNNIRIGKVGNAVGAERARRADMARISRDAARRDEKGISLDLKNRFAEYKAKKAAETSGAGAQPKPQINPNPQPKPQINPNPNPNPNPQPTPPAIVTGNNGEKDKSSGNNQSKPSMWNPSNWSTGAKWSAGAGAAAAIGTTAYLLGRKKHDDEDED